ncbi:efflux RND transporter permease subunit [Paenibacillus sp. Aloe-11]|uniref:efflux RND transporter permease subunit n=1 Tax=Paenibacillus sp. Aloe-11 TaxID=1050222 RepID=UPI00024F039D|nr:efflux RND transporter permease subunit [Paenibacillus sp. Aloe-11]EHS58697.1 multidrug ABC transporter [Paenibacillus sp. Aloe-11]
MIEYFIRKKKLILFIFAMAIVAGFYSASQLPRQEMPDIIQKTAIVTTLYPGAAPEKVEQTVTKPLEQKMKELNHIKKISSTSENGLSTIVIETEGYANAKEVWDELRKKMNDVQSALPADAQKPVVYDDLNKVFIHSYAITADSAKQLYQLNDMVKSWRDQLKTVPGVSEVIIKGLPEQEVQIQIDAQKLQQYHISWEQLMSAVQKENEQNPIGNLDYNERTYRMNVHQSKNAQDLSKVIISRTESGAPVYLQDVGTVLLTHNTSSYMSFFNGKPAITLTINGNTGSDVETIYGKINEEMKLLQPELPNTYQLNTLFSQTERINHIFSNLTRELLFAIAAVILVCTLGLNLMTSAFVALAIPISIGIGFILLPLLGVTLNQVTVIGLIIVMGILVDDAVVVNDNIERRMVTMGESPKIAAIHGTKEVAVSIRTATLATVASFAPLFFISGDAGSFAKPLPFSVILTLLSSMLMALTVIPIFREWYGQRSQKTNGSTKPSGLLGKQIDALRNVYAGKLIPKVLKRPALYAASGLLISTILYGVLAFIPVDLFPRTNDPQLSINVRMPIGTSIEETRQVTEDIAKWVKQQPHVRTISYAAGGDAPPLFQDMTADAKTGTTVGQIAVVGEEGEFDPDEMAERWSTVLKDRYPGQSISVKIAKVGLPLGKPISIRILGNDVNQLRTLSQQLKEAVMATKGTQDVNDNMENEGYTLDFQLNKQAMDQYLVSNNDLTRTLLLMGNGVSFSRFDTGNDLINIKLKADQADQNPEILFQQLNVTNANGVQIPLSQLAELKPSFATQKMNHYNLKRSITVEAEVHGRTASEVMKDVELKLQDIKFPPGYTWEIGGELSEQYDILAELGSLYVVVLFLIFMLIFLQFYSFTTPLIILTTVYMAAAGGFLGLFLLNIPITFMGVLGLMTLAGIIVRNGVVLIEFIEEARREGTDLKEAVIAATKARFRPILLTSVTAIVGLLPIALIGEHMFRPLAYTIISGLMYSTILTMFVVPSLYMVIARWKLKRQSKGGYNEENNE